MRRPKNSNLWMWVAGLSLFLGGARALAQGGLWTTKAPLPSPVAAAASGVINGKLYLAGGFNLASGCLASTLVYDPATNTWEARAPMPAARDEAVGAVVDGVLYVIGGSNDQGSTLRTVEAYDPNTNTWSEKAPMPTPRSAAAEGVVGGVIYVAGGWGYLGPNLKTLEAYDPKTNTWTTEAPVPTGRFGAASAVIGGILYLAGGMQAGTGGTSLRTVEAYNPRTNSWSTRTQAPYQFGWSAVTGVIAGKFYVAGGYDLTQNGSFTIRNNLSAYDPGSDSWLLEPSMPTGRLSAGGGGVGDVLYVVGGEACVGFGFCSSPIVAANEAFSPYLPVGIRVNPATINLRSNAKIKVAILSTSMFDATSVIPDSVKLSGALAETERNGTPIFSFDDVNDDGILDMVLTFRARDLQLTKADKQVVLKGQTFAGQLIKGVATVRIVP
ncbi:MAG TPA: kelch repeat-containing protein [Terriglobia bacterium]|nr:kelch repeat-containing protein [Terriglobia bacterium]